MRQVERGALREPAEWRGLLSDLLDDDALADLARAGVRASFADDTLKQEMEAGIDIWLGKEQP